MSATAPTAAARRPAPGRGRGRAIVRAVGPAVGIGIVGLVVVLALAGDLIAPGATTQDVLTGVTGPGSPGHLLGTDTLGRDVLGMTIAGARSAVVGPVVVALGSMLTGLLLGLAAGYLGGIVDLVATRYADLVLALPVTLVGLVVAGVLGGGYWVTVGVLVVLFSPSDLKLVRAAVLEQASRPYIEAARVLGIGRVRIMWRHIAPNVAPVVVANLLLNVAFALVAMSSLSFLGLGVAPGAPDWGRQLADGRELLGSNPAAAVVPGLALVVVATTVNLLGDWLQARLDPALRTR